jgi:hypothetical protein
MFLIIKFLGRSTVCICAVLAGTVLRASGAQVLVLQSLHHDVSPALPTLPRATRITQAGIPHGEAEPVLPLSLPTGLKPPGEPDPALQNQYPLVARVPRLSRMTPFSATTLPTIDVSFPGIGAAQYVLGIPSPDTNGDVGTTQHVQPVNSAVRVSAIEFLLWRLVG